MNGRGQLIGFISILLSVFLLCSSQEEVKKPTFPDVFQVEVQGIFMDHNAEVDGSMFYDKTNNRAAIRFTYQGVKQKQIYNFNDDEFIKIEGNDCQVSKIDLESGAMFFPFTLKDNKKIMANPDDVLYFTKSTLDRQDLSVFPSYVYTAKLDFPLYGRTGCDVTHIFSKPEVELPDCEGHACKPTLVAISVRCPAIDQDIPLMDHTYNFFRFKGGDVDPEVFQAPDGIHCNSKSTKIFPGFPDYFSFAYDRYENQEEEGVVGLYAVHKRVWYDSKLTIIRMDEFDNDGLITSSRIFDFYGGTAYNVVSSLSECVAGPLDEDVALDQVTQLPKIFFKKNPTYEDALYVGERKVQGVYYEVWSLSYTDAETDAMIVEEFYFFNILPATLQISPAKLQISHAHIYTYERNDETELFELSVLLRLTINNFRSVPKEWEAFDVSSCFENEEKIGFKLKVEGPPTVKESRSYEEILEKMYMRLIITTNVSVVRINELTGIFDGVKISEFTGWILNKTQAENSEKGKLEPDMHTAYRMIEDAATAGKLSLKFKKDGKHVIYQDGIFPRDCMDEMDQCHGLRRSPAITNAGLFLVRDIRYVITAIEDVPVPIPEKTKKDCFSGGSLAAASLVLLVLGFSFGVVGYYVFLKKRRSSRSDDKVHLSPM